MIEKEKAYTYDEIKDVIVKATANAIHDLSKQLDAAGINDTSFNMQTSMIYLMAYTDLNRILFSKKEEE
jgi:hypothetical protein